MKIIVGFYFFFATIFLIGAVLGMKDRGVPILIYGVVVSTFAVFIGIQLSKFSGTARVIAMWLNVVFLFGFPIGTAFAVYSWRYFVKQKDLFKKK